MEPPELAQQRQEKGGFGIKSGRALCSGALVCEPLPGQFAKQFAYFSSKEHGRK
jgi:hypothetical protein